MDNPRSNVSTGRLKMKSPADVRARVVPSSVAAVGIVPNRAVFCGAVNPVNPVRTSTSTTGPLLNENDPDTYTKSEIRNNTLSAEAPINGCVNSNALVVPAVSTWTRYPSGSVPVSTPSHESSGNDTVKSTTGGGDVNNAGHGPGTNDPRFTRTWVLLAVNVISGIPSNATVARANAITWGVFAGAGLIVAFVWQGLVDIDDLWQAALITLFYMGGAFIGARAFKKASEKLFRRVVLISLLGLSIIGVAT